jgi:hypothetical protein
MGAWMVGGLLGGLAASVTSTLAQLLLWALFEPRGALDLLWRDTRLAAAILLGPHVLPPSTSSAAAAFAAASLVHLLLSLGFALAIAWLLPRLKLPAWLGGGLMGLLLYLGALHGATIFLPWFEEARGWITVLAHAVFGMTAAMVADAWLRRVEQRKFHVHSAASRP